MADLSANFVISPLSANFVVNNQLSAEFVVEKNINLQLNVEGVYVANGYNNKATGPEMAVQYNIANALTGNANLIFNPTTATLTTPKIAANLVSNLANITVANISNLVLDGASNLHIGGGANTQVLSTDGNGNISWQTVSARPAGVNGQIQYNIDSAFSASDALNFDVANSQLNVVNLFANGKVQLGAVTDVAITGGTTGQVLSTDGAGGLSWRAPTPTLPAGTNYTVQYNSSGLFAATSTFTYNPTTDLLSAVHLKGEGGNISNIQLANTANVANTVAVAAQPNITSVGTLTSLTVGGVTNLGPVGNVKITGGTAGYYLQTDGSGGLAWSAAGGGSGIPGGLTTQVQYNDTGLFAGTANFAFNKTSNTLSVDYIVANGNAIANITGANVTGIVANANFASYSNVANSANLANIANSATVANSANSVAGANVTGTVANAAHAVVAATAYSVDVANIVGTVSNGNYSAYAGNVTIGAQPNITSVGTLTELTVNGAVSLGDVANVGISGGTFGQVLYSDGAGKLFWGAGGGGGGVTGSPTSIDFTFTGTTASSTSLGRDETITFAFSPIYSARAKTGPGEFITIDSGVANGNIIYSTVGASENQAIVVGKKSIGGNAVYFYGVSATNVISLKGNIIVANTVGNTELSNEIVVYDSANSTFIYAGTANNTSNTATIYSYKSTDNGTTWVGNTASFPTQAFTSSIQIGRTKFVNGNVYFSSANGFVKTSLAFSSMNSINVGTSTYPMIENVGNFSSDRRWWALPSGSSNIYYAATDTASTWTQVAVGSNAAHLRGLATDGSQLLAWGGKSTIGAVYKYIYKTVDGVYWYEVSPALTDQDGEIQFMIYDGSRFLVGTSSVLSVGGTTRILTSTDGETWNSQIVSDVSRFKYAAKFGEIDIAVAESATTSNRMWIGGGTPATSYTITLPAHGSYTTTQFVYEPTVGLSYDLLARELGSKITTARSTYSVSYPADGYITIDTNSAANIPDISMKQTGGTPTGTFTFTISQGGSGATYARDVVTVTDKAKGQAFIYSPAYGESLSTVVNSIVATENIDDWTGSVQSANSIQATARFAKTTNGYTPPSERIDITVTQGSGSTLTVTPTIRNTGF
jgi:hypothetical protein